MNTAKEDLSEDLSNGYEAVADAFIARRALSRVGVADVREWARSYPRGADVLDLGCGHGVPITRALIDEGLNVFAVDASPTLLTAFRERFPDVPTECGEAERSPLFGRSFDGVLAWGLMFLLRPERQNALLERAATVLRPGGKLLFTSPSQVCRWSDNLTGRMSISLGAEEYGRRARAAGLVLGREWDDEGQNHYYAFVKPTHGSRA